MTKHQAKTYPNGLIKSHLYESILNYFDFGIPGPKFDEELFSIRREEAQGGAIVSWYEDVDGKLIVADLELKDPFLRIEIIKNGFRKVPVASRRGSVAKTKTVRRPKDLVALFTPYSAVPDPFRFVGRKEEVARIINELPVHGKLFAISGERSLGKSSFLRLIEHLFDGNTEIEKFYGVDHNFVLDESFRIIRIDASVGPKNIVSLAKHLCMQLTGDVSEKEQTSQKLAFKLFGISDFEITKTKTLTTDDYIQIISELIVSLHNRQKKRLVLLIDELDQYSNPDELASLIRNLSSLGALVCIAGSTQAINQLISGHISLLRDTVQLKLEPFSEIDFREIFFLANLMAKDIVQFDSRSVDIMWEHSSGLPYFAQLFGYLAIRNLVKEYGSHAEVFRERRSKGPAIITEDAINMVLKSLPSSCGQYEDCISILIKALQGSSSLLYRLAEEGELPISNLDPISYSDRFLEYMELSRSSNPLLRKLLVLETGKIRLEDPTLRQYIKIRQMFEKEQNHLKTT